MNETTMSVTQHADYTTSATAYVSFENAAGQVWDATAGSPIAQPTVSGSPWINGHAIATATESPTGVYTWTVPANLPAGDWTQCFYVQAGGSPSRTSDNVVATGTLRWNGSAELFFSQNWSTGGVLVGDKIGYALTSGEHSAISGTDVPAALTAQGYTTTRAGYLDTLNGVVAEVWNASTSGFTTSGSIGKLFGDKVSGITGQVASQADVQALQNNTTISIVLAPWLQIPASGSQAYPFAIYLYDADGNMINADSTPTVTLTDQNGSSLSPKLSALSTSTTGRYTGTITISNGDSETIANMEVTATVGGQTRILAMQADVALYASTYFTTTDRSTLNAAATATSLASLASQVGTAGSGLTSLPAVVLATSQPNYAPAKDGDQMNLVTGLNSGAVSAIQAGLATSAAVATLQTTASTINTNASTAATQATTAATQATAAASNIGTAGSGLTNLGDSRIANLNATISSRAAAGSQMDLITGLNAGAVSAIQNGLATASALAVVASSISTDTAPAVSALAIVQADIYIDTTTVPWSEVWIQMGTGGLTDGTVLMRKYLKDTSGLNVTTATAVIGQKYTAS